MGEWIMNENKILIIYLLVINVLAFLTFGWDKLQEDWEPLSG